MKIPSATRLTETFRDLTRANALEACEDPDEQDALHEDLGGLMAITETIAIWRSNASR